MMSVDKLQADSVNTLFQKPMTFQKPASDQVKNQNSITQGLDLSANMLSVDKTQQILQNELVGKLEKRFKLEGVELKGLNANNFTPEKVAGRILNFIELGISRAGNDEDKKSMLEQARKGVEQGFKEARNILDAIGVLNGKVKEDVNKTYDLIQAGFDKLGKPIVDENDPKQQEDKNQVGLIDQAGIATSASQQSRQTSVEIMTRDGDKVTINLSREQSQSSSQFYAKDGNQSVYGASSSSSSYTNIQYQVNGQLDKGEKAAIDDLLNQLNGVAKDFYQGDINSAFNKAKDLGFNSNELAQFSVDMSYQKSSQVAVSSYQNIQQDSNNASSNASSNISNNKNETNSQTASVIKEVTDFMSKMDQVFKQNAFDFFANAQKSMADLLNASIALQTNDSDNDNDNDSANKGLDKDKNTQTSSQSINEMLKSLQGLANNESIA